MPVASVSFTYEGTIHSPFSGLPADTDDGPNGADPTLVFTYHGDGGSYGLLAARLADRFPDDVEELEPLELAEQLQLENLIVLIVDAGWNGISYYGYAPADDDADASSTESSPSHRTPSRHVGGP